MLRTESALTPLAQPSAGRAPHAHAPQIVLEKHEGPLLRRNDATETVPNTAYRDGHTGRALRGHLHHRRHRARRARGRQPAVAGQADTASSAENATFAAGAATDGNTGTRCPAPSATHSGSRSTSARPRASARCAELEAAFGKSFQIQTSSNATTWTTIFSTPPGPAASRRST